MAFDDQLGGVDLRVHLAAPAHDHRFAGDDLPFDLPIHPDAALEDQRTAQPAPLADTAVALIIFRLDVDLVHGLVGNRTERHVFDGQRRIGGELFVPSRE